MFALKKLLAPNICRTVTQNVVRYSRKDPGIAWRKKLLEISEYDPDLDPDNFESDFSEVGKSHMQHEKETALREDQLKYHIVKQKYFKEKYPNFLTWHDKEQIRYLYSTDPEHWTLENLAESFPALPDTIKKIVHSNWTKTKQNKITNHDKSVQLNWERFKGGEMRELPPDLVEHLQKFSNRALNFKPFEIASFKGKYVKTMNKNIGTEFADIITSYNQLKNNTQTVNTEELHEESIEEIISHRSKSSKQTVTLKQLQHQIEEQVSSGQTIEEHDKLILQTGMKSQAINEAKDLNLIELETTKKFVMKKVKEPEVAVVSYPEEIRIPAKVFRKGCLYKLNDCFYDDDGTFLYRVPGLYNSKV